jgi:hypothetical protein
VAVVVVAVAVAQMKKNLAQTVVVAVSQTNHRQNVTMTHMGLRGKGGFPPVAMGKRIPWRSDAWHYGCAIQ